MQCRHVWKRAEAARGAEHHVLAVAAPAHHFVVAAVEGELLRSAALGRDNEDVVVAVAIRRERDPFAVRREARIDVARRVIADAARTGAIFTGGPQIAEIAE